MKYFTLTVTLVAMAATPLVAENRIDGQSPDAPELAAYGPYAVGVRQLEFVNPNQVDVAALITSDSLPAALPRYDRPLTVEMWYPALAGSTGDTSINTFMRDGLTPITLEGRAVRDAMAATVDKPLPLVLMSHGFPGNRFLMSHLAENIASKGYVVASIDHTDSIYQDNRDLATGRSLFGSTLRNRPLDQLFVLDEMARLNTDATSGVAGLIDTDNTGLIGYSMGGYGALITGGAGVTEASVDFGFSPPNDTLDIHESGSDTHNALPDDRIKTAVTIGPWGRNSGFFDAETLAGFGIPLFVIGGAEDGVSLYENGVRAIWEEATGVDRALLTYDGAGHNAAAPIPVPQEAIGTPFESHYTSPGWDTVFMNNIAQHFITAWLDTELKGDAAKAAYLDLAPVGSEGVFARNADGTPTAENSYWLGFQEGTADRLRFERLAAGQSPSPVPLPASVWLLAAAIGGLGLRSRRARRG